MGKLRENDVHDNALYVNNAKNVSVNSIHGFDAYRFDLPKDVNNNDTVLTINSQNEPVIVDAQKISINNYDHHTSLNVNLIDAYGEGSLSIEGGNGSSHQNRTASYPPPTIC
ncbi:MAG: hypothetical protein LBJ79_03420 [Endomicrobium sp.]|jgi:hypothetical protein|nr:hypothetical protein [Endomicrobium sp.]